jgi:hypothetical protein
MNDLESIKKSIQSLSSQLSSLQKEVASLSSKFANHKHGGSDGTQMLPSTNRIDASQVNIYGGAFLDGKSGLMQTPLSVIGSTSDQPKTSRRAIGMAVGGPGIDTSDEFLQGVTSVGVDTPDKLDTLNKFDFSKVNFAQTTIAHLTYDTGNPPTSFFFGMRSPIIVSTGSIVNGGSTLTDLSLSLSTTDELTIVGCYIVLQDPAHKSFETHVVSSFTKNTISLASGDTWLLATGNYAYVVYAPLYLGSGDYPWGRVYTASDIRFGIGPSDGSKVMFIKSGSGSPEGVVAAQNGSLFMDSTGRLFVKTTGGYSNTGWHQVTTS